MLLWSNSRNNIPPASQRNISIGVAYLNRTVCPSICPSLRLSVRYKSCVSHNSKINKGTLFKLHRKIKQNEKVCRAQNLGSCDQGQGHKQRFFTYKSCVSHNSKTNKGQLHRKTKQNEEVCRAQNLGSHDQGQGHSQRS